MRSLPTGARRYVVLAIIAAAAAVVAVGLAARTTGTQTAVPEMVAGPGMCVVDAQVTVDLDTDYEMGQVVAALHGDRRVAALATFTQRQEYEHYRSEFQDIPSLQSLARPGVLPATVWIAPAPGTDPRRLAAELRARFPNAHEVRIVSCYRPGGSFTPPVVVTT